MVVGNVELLALQNPQKYEHQIWLDIWHWTQLSRAINFLLKIMFLFCESIFNPGAEWPDAKLKEAQIFPKVAQKENTVV